MKKIRWSKIASPNWGDGKRMYFPYAEKFMEKFPWLAVRVFYVLIKTKEFFNREK